MKRVGLVSAAVALTFSALGVFAPHAYALGNTCTWTGTAGDGLFSSVGNWSGCAGVAPGDLDSLAFDTTPLTTADVNLNNDLPGLQVAGIQLSGTGTYSYVVTGNELLIAGDLTSNATSNLYLLTNTTLAADISLKHTGTDYGYIRLAKSNNQQSVVTNGTMNMNGHTLTIDGQGMYVFMSNLTGAGNIHLINNGALQFSYATTSNPGWTGSVTADSGTIVALWPGQIPSSVPISINSGASMMFCGFNGANFANALSVGGTGQNNWGAIGISNGIGCAGFGAYAPGFDAAASVNMTGPVTLTADTTVNGPGELKISGSLSGNHAVAMTPSQDGKITIASSNNTSGTQNGSQESVGVTTAYSGDRPTDFITLGTKDTGILSGTYQSADVYGLFKGNGIIKTSIFVYATGHIAPGNSPGCITSDTLSLSGEYLVDLGGNTPCTGYDQLKVLNASAAAGAVTLDNTSSVLTTSRYNNYTPKQSDVFVIIDQAGVAAVSGTFKGLPEGATFSQNGITFKISYVGGDGNDVTLTVMNQPTAPDTGVMILKSNPIVIVAGALVVAIALIGMAKFSKQRR